MNQESSLSGNGGKRNFPVQFLFYNILYNIKSQSPVNRSGIKINLCREAGFKHLTLKIRLDAGTVVRDGKDIILIIFRLRKLDGWIGFF